MGTPDFAVPALNSLLASHHEILAVVTGEDKRRGRGQQLHLTPVKELAIEHHLPVLQPASLKSEEFKRQLQEFSPDIFVVVAFRILPQSLIDIPRYGCINIHSSLLPKYRGAAPINWAVLNGDGETGISIFQIEAQVDTGDVLFQEKIAIDETDTFQEVHDRLSALGGQCIVKVLDDFEKGQIHRIPQDDSMATRAPKIYPEMGAINWSKRAAEIKNQIHGLSPFPGAFSFFNGKRVKFLRATYAMENHDAEPGTIIMRGKNALGIQTGDGVLYPLELQNEGKLAMALVNFLNGFQGKVGERFKL